MQSIGTLIRAIDLRALPVHAVARQSRKYIQRIAFVRPPAIDSHGEVFSMSIPITTGIFCVECGQLTAIVRRPLEFVRQNYIVKHYAEIIVVKLLDDFFRVGKDAGIPGERSIFRVPSGGAEASTEIDQRIAGKLFVAKCSGLGENFFAAGQRAMRLLVSETPQRRHFGVTGEPGVFSHDDGGVRGADKEDVEGGTGIGRPECTLRSSEIERSEGLMNKHRPSFGADDPRYRNTSSVRFQAISALSAHHAVG